MTTHLVSFTKPPSLACPPHTPVPTEQLPLNMDITGHFESASCVIEVDGSDTLAQVKGKLVAELGVPGARHGVRMKGGGDIGDDDMRICDTEMDEGCAVELYYTGANITLGVIPHLEKTYTLALSPCDRYLAVMCCETGVYIFDLETHERLCSFPCEFSRNTSFSPCSKWISCANEDTQCAEVRDVQTGALEHSFGDAGDEAQRQATVWSPCGTKLLSYCRNGSLQVWDIAAGVVVRELDHIADRYDDMVVAADKVAVLGVDSTSITVWDYTTGAEEFVLTCPSTVYYMALAPNQRFIAACCNKCVRVWNMDTGECKRVFESDSDNVWIDVAVSNDIVVSCSAVVLCLWSISTGTQLLRREFVQRLDSFGLAISSCGGVVMHSGDNKGVELVDISHLS